MLATVEVGGRLAVVSAIATSFHASAGDPTGYRTVDKFRKLELADGTGSIDDLLRDGNAVPGLATRIPSHEAFRLLGQDNGVTVFDAWWARGTTADQDPALLHLEEELFLTPLTS